MIQLYIHGGVGLDIKLCPTHVTPWTVAHQTPLSTGFPRQEYWSELPFPSPGDLPNSGIKLRTLVSPGLEVDSLILSHLGSTVGQIFCVSKCSIN